MAKQIMLRDLENGEIHGGIKLDNGDVICGCCGGLLEKAEEGTTWETIREYSNWIDLTEEVCGSDIDDDEPPKEE